MISTASILLWGTRIGTIHLEESKGYASFEYDEEFRRSGIEVSPIMMPLSSRVYEFPGLRGDAFHGLPGLLADSLPDRFGNAIIDEWLTRQGQSLQDFNAIDRLCYTGLRGMGALEYVPSNGPDVDLDEKVYVDEMVRFASDILSGRESIREKSDNLTYSQFLQLGTSAGGARAKAIIAWNPNTGDVRSGQVNLGEDFEYWLMKFDGVNGNGDHGLEDQIEYTQIEYAYSIMAKKAGIHMSECRLWEENGHKHFMTRRFDRQDGKKLHMQTLAALAHIDYNEPGLCSYERAAGYMRQLGLYATDVEQLFRRMAFNVVAVNQDDHVKNFSFLMEKDGIWTFAPAYDMTFSYDVTNRWLKAHQMSINGKRENVTEEDLLECGRNMDISTKRCKNMIQEVEEAVSHWEEIAAEVGIREKTYRYITDVMEKTCTTQIPISKI